MNKKRRPNWSSKEINVLIEEVERNVELILGPFSSTVTPEIRKRAWKYITFKVTITCTYAICGVSFVLNSSNFKT